MNSSRRPKLSLPYTILSSPDMVRLIAGEDFRYTLRGSEIEQWLPRLISRLNGSQTLGELIESLEEKIQPLAQQLLDRLYGERIAVDATPQQAHSPEKYHIELEGKGKLFETLKAPTSSPSTKRINLLCQDNLDYNAALDFNQRCLAKTTPWMWATTGPMARGYVSPLFLSGIGPCLACLIGQFEKLSPVPELYQELRQHGAEGNPFPSVPFPQEGIEILKNLILWKVAQTRESSPSPSLFRLHVLELNCLEIASHQLLRDPECPACRKK